MLPTALLATAVLEPPQGCERYVTCRGGCRCCVHRRQTGWSHWLCQKEPPMASVFLWKIMQVSQKCSSTQRRRFWRACCLTWLLMPVRPPLAWLHFFQDHVGPGRPSGGRSHCLMETYIFFVHAILYCVDLSPYVTRCLKKRGCTGYFDAIPASRPGPFCASQPNMMIPLHRASSHAWAGTGHGTV
jgi:hypothetical protein